MTPRRHALGIDIGGTKISAAIVGEHDTKVSPRTVPTPSAEGPDAILDTAAALAATVMAESRIAPAAFGAGSAGAFDLSGTVVNSTDHLRGWLGTKVAAGLAARLGAQVTVLNDVHAAALGEVVAAPDRRRTDSLLFVAVGTGIGGALVSRGRVVRGVSGMAGSVGHVRVRATSARTCSCGGQDHVEAFASGPAMERSYRELSGIDAGLADIGGRARNGDAAALAVIGDAARLLAYALAAAVAVTDVGEIVLGGGVMGLGDIFVSPLVAELRAELHPLFGGLQVRVSSLGTSAAIVGSARAAFRVLDGASGADLFA